MDGRNRSLLGSLVDLFPPDLTVEELHDFTGASMGVCVHVLREVDELRRLERLEYTDGIATELLGPEGRFNRAA